MDTFKLFLLTVHLVFLVPVQVSSESCHGTRVIGGEPVDIENYPYNAGLFYHETFICGSTIIGPKHVLTAAHCTHGYSNHELFIRAGSSIRGDGNKFQVNKIYQHPNYPNYYNINDISVLELSHRMDIANVKPIKIADNSNYNTDDLVTVTGWGCTEEFGDLPDQLRMVQLNILNNTLCEKQWGSSYTETKICVGYLDGGKDSCQGDSGGPLVYDNTLIGLVSNGLDCGKKGVPALYSDVASASNFIKGVIGNSQGRVEINISLGIIIVVYVMLKYL